MKKTPFLYAALAALLVPAHVAFAQRTPAAPDSAAIVAVAQDVLRAISTADSALARQKMLPGSQLIATNDPASPTVMARVQGDSAFYVMLGSRARKLMERMWSPTVWQQGSLAEVRAPYDFHIDGKFSHCGVDVFTLVKTRGEWRVAGIAYTVQREGCAPSPLGPP